MEVQELRLGNEIQYLSASGGYIDKTVDLQVLKILLESESAKDFKPIPLTEEWLRSFGFEDETYKKGYIGVEFKSNMTLDFVLTKPKFMGEWQKDYQFELREHRIVGVEYVHELQNLFFAITSTELDLKTLM